MSDQEKTPEETDRPESSEEQGGQVSEVARMPAEGEAEVSDGQSVAGNPDSPEPEEIGEIGPGFNQFRGDRRPMDGRDKSSRKESGGPGERSQDPA